MADSGQVERFVVVSASGERRAIAQCRCLGLTGTDNYIRQHGSAVYVGMVMVVYML